MKLKLFLLISLTLTFTAKAAASQFTNVVYVSTNILFSVHKADVAGAQTEFKSNEEIIWGLLGTTTNNIWYRHFPSGNFDFHLFDTQGREMAKTKKGLALTEVPRAPTKDELLSKKFMGYAIDSKGGEFRQLFRPEEMFTITNKGTYELELRIRLCVIMTNDVPDLDAMTDARNVTAEGLRFITNFGVLVSPPLRVKVIKD